MFAAADQRVASWVLEVLGSKVSFDAPTADADDLVVHAYLLELGQERPARERRRPPVHLVLRYLIATTAKDRARAHDALGALALAAVEHAEFAALFDGISPELWSSFGCPPLPAFRLQVPVIVERPEPTAPYVRELVIQSAAVVSLYGTVLGPEDTPLSDARIELPTQGLVARTDHRGQFAMTGVSAEPRQRRLKVRAKGRELAVVSDKGVSVDDPMIIRFESFESLEA